MKDNDGGQQTQATGNDKPQQCKKHIGNRTEDIGQLQQGQRWV
jgi:hypothetical protein